jgi:manganese/zinc/iron transport system substrate-binding protein
VKLFLRRIGVFLFVLTMLSACGQATAPAAPAADANRPLEAVATIGMVADIVEQVGGERVNVTGLMGAGVDPHLFKASEGDVQRISQADIVFYNGLNLEAGMARVFEQMQGRTMAVAVAEKVDQTLLLPSEEYDNQFDPHIWFDVSLWQKAVERVRDALIERDPNHAATYRSNAERYLGELNELHTYVKEQSAKVPAEQRVLITAHDAFNYFGKAYGFEVTGLQGISTAAEAGTADVQQLADFIAERRIPAIFVETSVPPRTIEAVQAAVRAKGFEVKIGGELFSDAMGNPGTPEGTYIGMVRHNIDTIVSALTQ